MDEVADRGSTCKANRPSAQQFSRSNHGSPLASAIERSSRPSFFRARDLQPLVYRSIARESAGSERRIEEVRFASDKVLCIYGTGSMAAAAITECDSAGFGRMIGDIVPP